MSKKAIAYIRVSSESQEDNTSLESQKAAISAYAIHEQFDIVATYKDIDSGVNEHREGLTKLRSAIKSSKFDAVIVFKIDRFTRDLELGEHVRKEIEANGGVLISASEKFDTKDPAGLAFMQMTQVFAAFERNQIKNRLKLGKTNTVVKKGSWLGGTAPFGYKAVGSRQSPAGGTLLIDEQEAIAVKACFSFYENGMSFGEIAKKMNDNGFKTKRGCKFDKTTIFRIIKRFEVYNQNKAVNSSYKLDCQAIQPKIL